MNTIDIDKRTWKQEFNLLKSELLEQVNEKCGTRKSNQQQSSTSDTDSVEFLCPSSWQDVSVHMLIVLVQDAAEQRA